MRSVCCGIIRPHVEVKSRRVRAGGEEHKGNKGDSESESDSRCLRCALGIDWKPDLIYTA
jgi:hypothetical protein